MGQFYDSIPPHLIKWIKEQHVFWVASAPLSAEGHVNLSPKGTFGRFHVENENKVWYEDQTGSGAETIAHIRENGRITLLFCAFDGPPRIVRLFGTGTVHEYGTPEFDELVPEETRMPGVRAAILIDVHKVGSSCGYGIPLYAFEGNRTKLLDFSHKYEQKEFAVLESQNSHDKVDSSEDSSTSSSEDHDANEPPPPYPKDSLRGYWVMSNSKSIDGLPSLRDALISSSPPRGEWNDERKAFIKDGAGIASPESKKSAKMASSTLPPGASVIGPSPGILRRCMEGDGATILGAFALGAFASLFFDRLLRMA